MMTQPEGIGWMVKYDLYEGLGRPCCLASPYHIIDHWQGGRKSSGMPSMSRHGQDVISEIGMSSGWRACRQRARLDGHVIGMVGMVEHDMSMLGMTSYDSQTPAMTQPEGIGWAVK